ncbi:MAG: hypothetical protein WEE89_21165 [Gemmatimonadota bacterium]
MQSVPRQANSYPTSDHVIAAGWSERVMHGALVLLALSACDARPSSKALSALPPVSTSIATLDTAASIPESSEAWWLWARFRPAGDAIEGMPVAQLESSWVRASRLGRASLPTESQANPGALPDSTVDFVQDGDFNNDGSPDRALVGVFETGAGARGRFLVVLTRKSGQWERAFLHQEPEPGFQVLQRDSAGLTVWSCMECDSYAELHWTGTAYQMVVQACCPDPADDTATITRTGLHRRGRSNRPAKLEMQPLTFGGF